MTRAEQLLASRLFAEATASIHLAEKGSLIV